MQDMTNQITSPNKASTICLSFCNKTTQGK